MSTTATGQHELRQIIMTPVLLVGEGEEKTVIPDPEGEEQVRYGCIACNMGLEEAKELPCPGFDLFDPEVS